MNASPLDPEYRLRDGATRGADVTLSDGRSWTLADGGLRNELDPVRDRLFDESTLDGQVGMPDVLLAAEVLLLANYELDGPELAGLVCRADAQALADGVLAALFGPQGGRRTYTAWAASALVANGIDPASVPVELMPGVLAHLEASGRCVPRSKVIDSAVAAPRLARARQMAEARAAAATPEAPRAEG